MYLQASAITPQAGRQLAGVYTATTALDEWNEI